MLSGREVLRQKMKKELIEVVKEWGVWIETVEVNNVIICSTQLFRDMQTNFREKARREAEICSMNFAQDIAKIKQEYVTK